MRHLLTAACLTLCLDPLAAAEGLRAGAAAVDVSPPKLPAIINGNFLEARSETIHDRLYARALVLDDGANRVALAVVDSCMMPRELIDHAKVLASQETGIPVDRMLVSATHTHSAPSAMGALGSRPDPDYVAYLPGRIAEAIVQAAGRLEPARVGWGVVDDPEHTHNRRWIRRPDRMLADPFGDVNVRANMHPGHESPDVVGPSGPVDPGLSVLSVQAADGRPIALLANYSMHYFGAAPISADYFGRFSEIVAEKIGGAADAERPFVAMMSQGTSGDLMWMDYAAPKADPGLEAYAQALADRALEAYGTIAYRDEVPVVMGEFRLTLGRRVPDQSRLDWARKVVEAMTDDVPKSLPEVYAQEAIFLHEEPERELVLQTLRIGDLGIAAIPNEVFALTGLKIKARSPLAATFTIELANGSDGYIPPAEQHALGGYTTWPARTAGLEVGAEREIVEAILRLMEDVAVAPRLAPEQPHGAHAQTVLAAKPAAYWRLGEMDGREAADATGKGPAATLEPGYALYLDGPTGPGLSGAGGINRAVHLAGGRLTAELPNFGSNHAVAFWFWNGLPNDARATTATLLAYGGAPILTLGGSAGSPGRLSLGAGAGEAGATEIAPRTWHHVVLVRDGQAIAVYLDGRHELAGALPSTPIGAPLHVGGGANAEARLEGKLDEVAVFDRPLSADEVRALTDAAGGGTP
jgi:hypothetical protein